MTPFLISEIRVDPARQRKHFDMAKIVELANSIKLLGLLQPIVIRADGTLVAGERRLRALRHLAQLGVAIRCNGQTLAQGYAPTLCFDSDSEVALEEAQLDENIKREDLTWQERAAAIELLHRLRARANPTQTVSATARELYAPGNEVAVADALRVAKHLALPEVAAAPTLKEAVRVLQKREEKARLATLAENVNVTKLSDKHRLIQSDFRTSDIGDGTADVILTDPPYGVGADSFKDGGGTIGGLHQYADAGGADWEALMRDFAPWSFAKTKPRAHLYAFCDIDAFPFLRELFTLAGWKVHRTPFIYAKSHASSRRVPWPTSGPRRSYELILYAIRGDRNVNAIASDVVGPFPTDAQLDHAAQKPVELYSELLRRSVEPGNTVLDPFAGTGPIFPAAHALKCKAIGCEIDPAFQGICLERIQKLKE